MRRIELHVVVPLRLRRWRRSIGSNRQILHHPNLIHLHEIVEHERMVTWFSTQQELKIHVLKVFDVRTVAGQTVFDHDALQLWMHLTNSSQQSPDGIAFAIILVVAILLDNGFQGYGDDFLAIGVNKNSYYQLMRILRRSVLVILDQAMRTLDGCRREITSAIDRQQIIPLMKNKAFEHATALQLVKDVGKAFIELFRVNWIEDLAMLSVAWNGLDLVEIHQALVFSPLIESKQRRVLE